MQKQRQDNGNERKKDNDPKATGSFILAALELDK